MFCPQNGPQNSTPPSGCILGETTAPPPPDEFRRRPSFGRPPGRAPPFGRPPGRAPSSLQWCTFAGTLGDGWQSSWGTIAGPGFPWRGAHWSPGLVVFLSTGHCGGRLGSEPLFGTAHPSPLTKKVPPPGELTHAADQIIHMAQSKAHLKTLDISNHKEIFSVYGKCCLSMLQ